MRKLPILVMLILGISITSCKNENKEEKEGQANRETVSISHLKGSTDVPVKPERVVVLDYSALENLDLIDVNVVGMTKNAAPAYLSKYEDDESIANLGNLKEVDLEKINELEPDLIIAGRRLADSYESLSQIAPTFYPEFDMANPMSGLKTNLDNLGKIFKEEETFDKAYNELSEKIDNAKEKIKDSDKKALIVLHNKGRFSAYGSGSRFGMVHDVLGVKEIVSGLDTHLHGTRISNEFIQENNPDILFIVDRSAAIGDQALNKEGVENELVQRTNAYENGNIVYVNPEVWYLSGIEGIKAMGTMVDEVSAVFDK